MNAAITDLIAPQCVDLYALEQRTAEGQRTMKTIKLSAFKKGEQLEIAEAVFRLMASCLESKRLEKDGENWLPAEAGSHLGLLGKLCGLCEDLGLDEAWEVIDSRGEVTMCIDENGNPQIED